jgi:hypothetical protein
VEAALFTAREAASVDADLGVRIKPTAVRQHAGKQVCDVVVGCCGVGKTHVGRDRSGEQVVICQHGGDHAASPDMCGP